MRLIIDDFARAAVILLLLVSARAHIYSFYMVSILYISHAARPAKARRRSRFARHDTTVLSLFSQRNFYFVEFLLHAYMTYYIITAGEILSAKAEKICQMPCFICFYLAIAALLAFCNDFDYKARII